VGAFDAGTSEAPPAPEEASQEAAAAGSEAGSSNADAPPPAPQETSSGDLEESVAGPGSASVEEDGWDDFPRP